MDGQSEKGIPAADFETTHAVSAHVATLLDLSNEYIKPTESPQMVSEILRTQERLKPFTQEVEKRYQSVHSTIKETPRLLESFQQHNAEVVESAIFYAQLFGLSENQMLTAAASAALHDIAKADPVPSDIPDSLKTDYTLLMHPENGVTVVQSLFQLHPEWRNIMGKDNIKDVLQAIRCHSGPMPGFMQARLDFYNNQSEKPVELAAIDPSHTPSVILLSSDMLALGSPAGVRKIVQLRERATQFRIEDITKTIEDRRASTYEVRIDSALKSAYDGAAMVRDTMAKNPSLKDFADQNYRLMTAYFQRTKTELLAA